MGKIKEIQIKRFDGGIAFDTRTAQSNEFSKSINFDIYKKPSTLSPIRGIESDEGLGGDTDAIKDYDITAFGSSFAGNIVYGWGRKTTSDTGIKLFSKAPTDANWVAVDGLIADALVAMEETAGHPVPGSRIITTFDPASGSATLWSIVNNNDAIGSGTRQIAQVSFIAGVSSDLTEKALSSVAATVYEPNIILGQDGHAYCFNNNAVHRLNMSGTISSDVFTLSSASAWKITSMCLYDSYIAMAIKGFGRSKVLLWDYADTQATESIDFGEGTIIALENLNGILVAVMDKFINTNYNGTGASNGQGVMQIKVWDGGNVQVITEIKAGGVLAGATTNYHFVRNNILYWYAKIPTNAAATEFLEGIWAFGRATDAHPWALSLFREVPANFKSFHMQGDYTYIAHGTDGSVSRTKDDEAYGLTSTYESQIFDGGDRTQVKQLLGATLSFEILTSGQTVVLKYRKDGATTWDTLTPVPVQAVGDVQNIYPMVGNFYEIEFKIESTGGAKPNMLKFKYEELTNGND